MRLIVSLVFVLTTLFSGSTLARFSPDDEAKIKHREKISGKPLKTIDHAFAQVTLTEFAEYPSLMGPTDNPQNVVNVEFSTGDPILPRVHIMHMRELEWIAMKMKVVPHYIVVKADVAQYNGTPQEQHALRRIARQIAFWLAGLRATSTLSDINSRAGIVPTQTEGPLGASREVFSISVTVNFAGSKVPSPLFTHERMVTILFGHYRPTTVTVSLNEMPTDVLRAYPFLVQDLTILRH